MLNNIGASGLRENPLRNKRVYFDGAALQRHTNVQVTSDAADAVPKPAA